MKQIAQISDITNNLDTFTDHFHNAAAVDSSIIQSLEEARAVYDQSPKGHLEKSKAAAEFVRSVAKIVFDTHPNARRGIWLWNDLEDVAIDALSRIGGAANEVEHLARDAYVWLLRVGLQHLGAESHEADDLVVDTKPYYLSDEYLQEWVRARINRSRDEEKVSTLLGPDGRPLEQESERGSLVQTVHRDFLSILQGRSELLYDLSPREFEEFIADLLTRLGYTVNLTQVTRDGGKDIYAAKKDLLGSFLYAVECKRYAPHRRVGVEIVRELYGVVMKERVTAGILVTTSSFTDQAIKFQEEVRRQISLRDYQEIQHWLKAARERF